MTPRVAGVVVTHGPYPGLAACLAALDAEVDELVVVANLPGPIDGVPATATVLENPRPVGFAANVNRGVAATTAPFVVIANPDATAARGAVGTLVRFAAAHERCGIAGPRLHWPDGRWQPSRRRFPTVAGTLVRRTPIRLLVPPLRFQRAHYQLDERPSEPTPTDWMIGGFLLLRREMLDELGGFDDGYRLYCEEIDLCYRAARSGWERWYVPDAVVAHDWAAVIDRRFMSRNTLWHLRGMARFIRKHPERLRALI